MKITVLNVLVLIVIFHVFRDVSTECSFPSVLEGIWSSSVLGLLALNSTRLDGITVSTFGKQQFECIENNQTRYLLRSDTFTFSTVDFQAFICFDFRPVTNNIVVYQRITSRDSQNQDERVLIRSAGTAVTMEQACVEQEPYPSEMFSILARKESLDGGLSIKCPEIILGEFLVSYADSTGKSECPNGAFLDVCNDKNKMAFNYTKCGSSNSLPENLTCLYSKTDDATNTTYFSVYSQLHSKFFCMAATEDSNQTMFMSQRETDCSEGQTPTAVDASGRLMELTVEVNSTGECEVDLGMVTTISPTSESNSPNVGAGQGGSTTQAYNKVDDLCIQIFEVLIIASIGIFMITMA